MAKNSTANGSTQQTQKVIKYVPCIFVGLGGSGCNIISSIREKIFFRLKREGLDVQDYLDKVFQFVAIDTTNRGHAHRGVPRSNYVVLGNFDGNPVVELESKQHSVEFSKWWYKDYWPGNLMEGAGMIRLNGRLCLIQNMKGAGVNAIGAISASCQSAMNLLNEGTAPTTAVKVYFFSSMCGGTGSGILMDLAVLSRKILNPMNPWIFSYLINPEIVVKVAGENEKPQLYANAYAFCKELSFWQDPINYKKYNVDLMGQNISLPAGKKVFDLVHVFSGRNEAAREIPSYETAHKLIADIVYYSAISPHTGQRGSDSLCNHVAFYNNRGTGVLKDNNTGAERAISFGSGGMAHLRFPQEKVRSYLGMGLLEDFVRNYVWQEPDASGLFHDFMTNRSGVNAKNVKEGILKDVKLPPEPTGWREKIRESKESDWESCGNEVEKGIEGYKGNLGSYLEAKSAGLFEGFKQALDGTLMNVLDSTGGPRRIGLVAQFLEKVQRELEGRVRKGKEKKAGFEKSFAEEVEDLSEELGKLTRFKLKDSKESLRDAFSKSGLLVWIKSRGIRDAKEGLEGVYEGLVEKGRDYLIGLMLSGCFEKCLQIVESRKRGVRYLRKEMLNLIQDKVGTERPNVLTGDRYDDDCGGVVIEVLGDAQWVNKSEYSRRYRKEEDRDDMDALASELLTMVLGGGYTSVVEELKRVWLDIDRGIKENLVGQRMLEMSVLAFDKLLGKCKGVFDDLMEFSVWDALEEEAKREGKFTGAQVKEHVNEKLTDLRNMAVPFWDLDQIVSNFVDRARRKEPITVAFSEEAFQAFSKKYSYGSLNDVFGLQMSSFTGIESYDPCGLSLVRFSYGAPLFALRIVEGSDGYHHYYEQQKAFGIPLHVDRRYDDLRDSSFGIPDLPFPEGSALNQLVFLVAEWFSPRKEEITLPDKTARIEYSVVPLETGAVSKEKGSREAFVSKDKSGKYMIHDGRGNKDMIRGREKAQAEFSTLKAFEGIRQQIDEYWRQQLTPSQRRNKLEQIKSFLEDWLRKTQKGKSQGEDLRSHIERDINTLNEKILMEGEYLF